MGTSQLGGAENTLYFNPKKSHWGGKIMLLKLLGMLNCLL
jgi:hypothetical protein